MYCKSCGSYLHFLNESFFLGKIYDSIWQCDAKMDKLLHVCKSLLQTGFCIISVSKKPQKQASDQASEGVVQDLQLKDLSVWTHGSISYGKLKVSF